MRHTRLAIALIGAFNLGATGPCGGSGDGGGSGEGTGGTGGSGGTPNELGGAGGGTTQHDVPPARPTALVAPTSITLAVPGACERSFAISNTGAPQSQLEWNVADDGALGGYLDVQGAVGRVNGGAPPNTARVSIKPMFRTPDLAVTALALSVYTPAAVNTQKSVVSVKVRQRADVAKDLLGTWEGAWSGTSYGRNPAGKPEPTAPVSGHFSMTLSSVDAIGETAAGTITWTGMDASWRYTYDQTGITSATPALFVPDRTISFDAKTAKLTPTANASFGSGCPAMRFRLMVKNETVANPSDAFYGPSIDVDLDAETGDLTTSGAGFSTHPYDPMNFDTGRSQGSITAKRMP